MGILAEKCKQHGAPETNLALASIILDAINHLNREKEGNTQIRNAMSWN